MQGQTLGSHDSIHFPELRKIHQELRKLVQTLGWTYAVIWKPTHDNGMLGWYQSWFNNRGTEEGKALELQFESVFRRCQFTQAKPGYAFRAWQARTGTWWARHMNRLPTDIHKELFLQQASIQTLICLPIRAPDGTTYCVELATNLLEVTLKILAAGKNLFVSSVLPPFFRSQTVREEHGTYSMAPIIHKPITSLGGRTIKAIGEITQELTSAVRTKFTNTLARCLLTLCNKEPQSRELQGSIQAFVNESVAPYISGHLPASSLQEVIMGGMSTQAGSSISANDLILSHRSSSAQEIAAMEAGASNPSTSYTMMQEEEPFGGYGVIARGEQDYMCWTVPGSNYASAALTKEYTGFVDPPSNSPGDQSLDVAVFKEYTQMATHVPNPVVSWSSHQSSSLGQVDHISAFTPPSTLVPSSQSSPHLLNQGPAGLDSVSSLNRWDLDVELPVAGQFEAPGLSTPPHGHNLVGISQTQLVPGDADLLNLYNLGRMGNTQPQSFQASGSASSQLPSTSAPRNHGLPFWHDSSRSPFRSSAQIDRMQSRLPQLSSSSSSSASRLGRPPYTVVVKPKGHLIQTWVRNWQEKRWQQQEADFGANLVEDARSPQTIAHDEHQAVKHMRAERVRRSMFNCRLQTLRSLVPIINKKKDKVTVLSSTIDYIRHLTSTLENRIGPPIPGPGVSEQQPHRPSTNITDQLPVQLPEELAGGASSSTGPVIVEVEPAVANGKGSSTTLVIRVEAQNHSRSLIHLLNVLHDRFGLQLTNLDYGCINDRFHATITIENPGNQDVSSVRVQLREALQRELTSPNGTPSTGSDLS